MEIENIEDLFEEELLDGILNTYKGLTKDNFLYYLMIKSEEEYLLNKKKIARSLEEKIEAIMDCLKNDLKIKDFTYNNIKIVPYLALKNSFRNIYESWLFSIENYIPSYPGFRFHSSDEALKYIKQIINSKVNPLSKKNPEISRLNIFITELNNFFNVTYSSYPLANIPQVDTSILTEKPIFQYNIGPISESQIEDYLIQHLEDIESGLKYKGRQIDIPEGRLDILAEDKEGKLVIIEVKNKTDKRLIWQCLYYPKAIPVNYKSKYEDIRMITICPDYPPYIKSVLEDLKMSNLDLFSYQIKRQGNKLIELNTKRLVA